MWQKLFQISVFQIACSSNKADTDICLLCYFYVVWPDPERWLIWVVYSWTQWRKWERAPPLKDVIEELFENDQVYIF